MACVNRWQDIHQRAGEDSFSRIDGAYVVTNLLHCEGFDNFPFSYLLIRIWCSCTQNLVELAPAALCGYVSGMADLLTVTVMLTHLPVCPICYFPQESWTQWLTLSHATNFVTCFTLHSWIDFWMPFLTVWHAPINLPRAGRTIGMLCLCAIFFSPCYSFVFSLEPYPYYVDFSVFQPSTLSRHLGTTGFKSIILVHQTESHSVATGVLATAQHA